MPMPHLIVRAGLPLIITTVFLSAVASAQPSREHPGIFITKPQVNAIKAKIKAGEQPWAYAYENLLERANNALSSTPLSVMAGPKVPYNPPYNDNHYYYHELQGKRTDYLNAVKMKDRARDLALAYTFSGKADYADKAREILRVWFLDEATRMYPSWAPWKAGNSMQAKYQNDIELAITMAGAIYAMDLLWDAMPPDEQKGYYDWCKEFGKSTFYATANRRAWTLQCLMACHLLTGETERFDGEVDMWKSFVGKNIFEDGTIKEDRDRKQGLRYSVYCLQALCSGAEIARNQGIDLFGYTDPNGRSLEQTLDTHAHYFLHQSDWPYSNEELNSGNPYPIYELAYSIYRKPQYLEVVKGLKGYGKGRPCYDIRTLGPLTLTHGNLFELKVENVFIAFDSPRPGSTVRAGSDVPVELAVKVEGSIAVRVELFDGKTLLKTFSKPPYAHTIAGIKTGTHTLRAVATSDGGMVKQDQLTITATDALQFVHLEAEKHDAMEGIASKDSHIGGCDDGDYIMFKDVVFDEAYSQFVANLGCPEWSAGQKVEVHLDAKDGPTVATLVVASTGAFGAFKEQQTTLKPTQGKHDVYIVFVGKNGVGNFDYVRFAKPGAAGK